MKTVTRPATILLLLAAASCSGGSSMDSGEADFSRVVTVGSSLTAGFMNGALYDEGQRHSFAAILAAQLRRAGGGAFNQPDIDAVNGYSGVAAGAPGIPDGTLLGRLYLEGTVDPVAVPRIPGDAITDYAGVRAKLDNFGAHRVTIPESMDPRLGGPPASNPHHDPYYRRFASSPGVSTLIGDASAALASGSFFVFWLGVDDALGYAAGGAEGAPVTSMTDPTSFAGAYAVALNAMLAANPAAKGIVGEVPDLTSFAYFTTVPWDAVSLEAGTAAQLTAGYQDFNDGIALYNAGGLPGQVAPPAADRRRPIISFTAGDNGIVIEDETLADLTAFGIPSIRQATSADLICLPAASELGVDRGDGPRGIQDPLEDRYALVPAELEAIQERIAAFNVSIAAAVAASSARLALVDVSDVLKALDGQAGRATPPATIGPSSEVSLDGLHPNARGNCRLANAFLGAINAKFGASVPPCRPEDFDANAPPAP